MGGAGRQHASPGRRAEATSWLAYGNKPCRTLKAFKCFGRHYSCHDQGEFEFRVDVLQRVRAATVSGRTEREFRSIPVPARSQQVLCFHMQRAARSVGMWNTSVQRRRTPPPSPTSVCITNGIANCTCPQDSAPLAADCADRAPKTWAKTAKSMSEHTSGTETRCQSKNSRPMILEETQNTRRLTEESANALE